MQTMQRTISGCVVLLVCCAACGDAERGGTLPWSDQRTQVIDTRRNVEDVEPPRGDACLAYAEPADDEACIRPQERCGTQAADVIVDERGRLVDVICYPAEGSVSVAEVGAADGNIAQQQNNSVLVLDGADDGVDLQGDLKVDANNVVVYGEGPDVSVIGGDVVIDGNNTLIRGVRIQGGVTVQFNDAVFALCVIEGNLTVTGNNTRFVGCDVFGDVVVQGNNTAFYGTGFGGSYEASGRNTECVDNFTFADDGDHSLSEQELAASTPFDCAPDAS